MLCHAATRAMREGAFPDPYEPLDAGGLQKARALTVRPAPEVVYVSPALAARQTNEVLDQAASVEPALADMDWGVWRGRRLIDLQAEDPQTLMAWIQGPAFGTPGGETFDDVLGRISTWMDGQAARDGRILAVTHQNVMRAALAYVLGLTSEAAFRIDIPPLAMLTLSFNRVWRFQGLSADGADV